MDQLVGYLHLFQTYMIVGFAWALGSWVFGRLQTGGFRIPFWSGRRRREWLRKTRL